jgi:hypothetical protein
MRKKILISLLLLECAPVFAADWRAVANSEKLADDADVASIRITGQVRRVWIKTVYAPQSKTDSESNKWWSYAVSRRAIDCHEETERGEALTVYYSDGSNHSVAPSSFPDPWQPVQPDTLSDSIMKFVCAWKSK